MRGTIVIVRDALHQLADGYGGEEAERYPGEKDVEHLRGPPNIAGKRIHGGNPLADPAHHRNRHRVAERLVARAIGALASGLPAPWDQRVIIGEALEAFALARGETTDSGRCAD